MTSFPIFIVKGRTPEEIGTDYGKQCRDIILEVISDYKKYFNGGYTAITWNEAKNISADFIPYIKEYSAGLLDELQGISKGSGAEFMDLLALNSRSEIMTLVNTRNGDTGGCTSVAVLPEASKDGDTIVAQNWDAHTWQGCGGIVLQVLEEGDAPDMMIVTEAGQLARYGLNQAGICLGVNSLHRVYNRKVYGVPSVFVRRTIIQQDRYADAVNRLFDAEGMLPLYYLIGCAEGDAMGFEVLKEGNLVLYPDGGLIVHSNHILHDRFAYQDDAVGGTLYRSRRIEKYLRPLVGRITINDLSDAFKDHFGYPFAVCRHGDDRKQELDRISTLGCIMMNATSRSLYACKDNPCCNEFREYIWENQEKASKWI